MESKETYEKDNFEAVTVDNSSLSLCIGTSNRLLNRVGAEEV
jgi:hypothetical protein